MCSKMKDSVHFNIEFIAEVEKHPYLYDYRLPDYSNRGLLESTWVKIAEIFNETSYDCKTKWKSIRSAYIRSLNTKYKTGSGVGSKKEYYLASNLEFLKPFLRSVSQKDASEKHGQNENESESEDSFEEETQQSSKYSFPDEIVNEDQPKQEIQSNQLDTDSFHFCSSSPLSTETTKHFKKAMIDSDKSVIEYNSPKRRKMDHNVEIGLNTEQCEAFLLSMVPHMVSMSQQQQLSFQRRILELIENIKYEQT